MSAARSIGGHVRERVARMFALSATTWERHANPWSVWTRFAILPLAVIAVWSRAWR